MYTEEIPVLQEGRSPSDHKLVNNVAKILQDNIKSPVVTQGDGVNTNQVKMASFTLSGGETQLQLEEEANNLLGSHWFTATFVPATPPGGPLAINGSDASKVDITGSVVAGSCIIYYN